MAYTATIGFFDGVHRGHHFLINQLLATAQMRGEQSAIITFEHHPKNYLNQPVPQLLTTYDERITLLKDCGVDEIFCFQFDIIQQLTAREFMTILHQRCGVTTLLMGYDHRFGSDQITDLATYQRIGQECGVQVMAIGQSPEGAISSSTIRRALSAGQIEQANRMLGYPYLLQGMVVHGKAIGRTLGFPTANISVDEHKLLPLSGVYAATIRWDHTAYNAIVNIGTNPTIEGEKAATVEVHIPQFNESIYGTHVQLQLLRYIRGEKKFATLDELRQQIIIDIQSLNA